MFDINIWKAFEMPSESDYGEKPAIHSLCSLRIELAELNAVDGWKNPLMTDISHPCLAELIKEYNNKVGSVIISYILCRHYFDKGIPDDPWVISPGKNGESIQYMPNFGEEHWGRRYWFSYFSNSFYLQISSLWDSVLEIINHYYGYNLPVDMRLRSQLIKRLKADHPIISGAFDSIMTEPIYTEAQKYRTAAAHGTSPSSIQKTVEYFQDAECEVPDHVENGKLIMKKVRGTKISYGAGEYTPVLKIMTNMDDYAAFCVTRIHAILSDMKSNP